MDSLSNTEFILLAAIFVGILSLGRRLKKIEKLLEQRDQPKEGNLNRESDSEFWKRYENTKPK